MGKLRTVLLLALGLGLTARGVLNSRTPHPVDAQAEAQACDVMHACDQADVHWSAVDAGPFARRYAMETGSGSVAVECRWSMLLFGTVRCQVHRNEMTDDVKDTPERLPHEVQRGPRARR